MVIFFMVRKRCKWFKMELKCSHSMNDLFANHEQHKERIKILANILYKEEKFF